MNETAERINGLAAMIGIVAAIGAYALTGDIIPGIFWIDLVNCRFTADIYFCNWSGVKTKL